MRFVILHGIGGYPGIHWQQWLHDELKTAGHDVFMPSLPKPSHPDRKEWAEAVGAAVSSGTTVFAHSLGVVSALDVAEDTPLTSLVSVSGFGRSYGSPLNDYFMVEREIDFAKVRHNLNESCVFYGDNDPYVPQSELKALAENLGIEARVIKNGGHLNTDAGFLKFPELLTHHLDSET